MRIRAVLNSRIIMTLLFLPYVEPFGTREMASSVGGVWKYIHLVFVAFRVISIVAIGLLMLYEINKPSSVFLLMLLHQIWIVIATIIYGNFSISRLESGIESIGIVLMLSYYIRYGNTRRLLSVIEAVLSFIIICNFLSMLLYPNGMYVNIRNWSKNWVLGYRNLHVQFYLPYIAVAEIKKFIDKDRKKIKDYFMSFVILVSTFLSHSATSMIAVLIVYLLSLFLSHRKLPKWINFVTFYYTSFIISGLIIFIGIQNYFSDFLMNVLGRDVTFSARTIIWSQALTLLNKNPIFGNGIVSIDSSGNFDDLLSVNQMHNMYLDLLVVGGIVLLLVFTITIFITNKKVMECKCIRLRNIYIFVFAAYQVLFITEARRNLALLNMFLYLAYSLPYIIKKFYIKEINVQIR